MRKVTYGAACSLDGFIAGPNHEVDWLHMSRDVQTIMADFWSRIDTLLMGRKTWEVAQAMGGGGAGATMTGIQSYVFSRTLNAIPPGQGTLVADDGGDFVRDLKRRPGKEICVFGGGDFARSLFEAGVIDEVGLNVHPVLLGAGIPIFRNAGRIRLKLSECREIAGGCVYTRYRVLRSRHRNLDLGHALNAAVG
jgi:dihydrofolate reductase